MAQGYSIIDIIMNIKSIEYIIIRIVYSYASSGVGIDIQISKGIVISCIHHYPSQHIGIYGGIGEAIIIAWLPIYSISHVSWKYGSTQYIIIGSRYKDYSIIGTMADFYIGEIIIRRIFQI